MASAVVEQAEEDEACRVSHCVSELLDAEALGVESMNSAPEVVKPFKATEMAGAMELCL